MLGSTQIVILAWGIENESSWKWFFSQLRDGLPDLDCEISDRDKGLQAAENDLEYANHVFCVQHLAENVKARFGMEARRKFIALTYARTNEQYNNGMDSLKETHRKGEASGEAMA